ncbi:MAG: class I SAM-dependent methyltransferase [Candidatus Nezhaarchaeales archaeon]
MSDIEEKARIEMSKVAKTYEAIAEGFSKTRRSPWMEMLHPLSELSEKLVLDVGCGNGRHLIEMAKNASLAVGIDLSRNLLNIARARMEKLKLTNKAMLVVGDATFMPFRSSAFDAIICIAVIHHIPTRELRRKALREMLRVMRVGGSIIISAWYRWQKGLIFSMLKSAIMKMIGMVFEFGDTYISWRTKKKTYKRFYHLFTTKEMEQLLKIRELKVEDLRIIEIGKRKWKNVVALAIKR